MVYFNDKKYLPCLTIIIPTYNSGNFIFGCLNSIKSQDYPQDKIEIIIVDGGSKDKTIEICNYFNISKIFNNPFIIEEKGRIIGINKSKNEILGFIDADNILPSKNWLRKIVMPFYDKSIVGSEPIEYSFRDDDNLITKYVGLIGADDPISIYLGNYDRFCYFRKNWTDSNIKIEFEDNNYIKFAIREDSIPPIGANGFFIRKNVLKEFKFTTFIHTNVIFNLVKNGYCEFAKVKIGIIHVQLNYKAYFLKKIRRIERLLNKELERDYNFIKMNKNIIFKIFLLLIVFPILIDTLKGYLMKHNKAWILHIVICPVLILVYCYEILKWKIYGIKNK